MHNPFELELLNELISMARDANIEFSVVPCQHYPGYHLLKFGDFAYRFDILNKEIIERMYIEVRIYFESKKRTNDI